MRIELANDPRTDANLPPYQGPTNSEPSSVHDAPPQGQGNFLKTACEVFFESQTYYSNYKDEKVEMVVKRKSLNIDFVLNLSLVYSDNDTSHDSYLITKIPLNLTFPPKQDKLSFTIEWDPEKFPPSRQVLNCELKTGDNDSKYIINLKRHKAMLNIDKERAIFAHNINTANTGNTGTIPSTPTFSKASPSQTVSPVLGENKVKDPAVASMCDLAIQLLWEKFPFADTSLLKEIMSQVSVMWNRIYPDKPLEFHIWIGLTNLSLLEMRKE
jgi:hypothetical protein